MTRKFLLITLTLILALGVVWTAGAQEDDEDEQPFIGVAVRLTDSGVQIVNISPNSPAEEAGLQPDEFIVSFDGETVENPEQLIDLVAGHEPGETVALVIRNDDGEREVEVEIGARPPATTDRRPDRDFEGPRDDDRRGPAIRIFENLQPYQLGVSFRSLTPEIAAEEGIDVAEGALVVEVVEDSPADDAGLQKGDVIVAVDGDAVDIEHTLSDRLFAYEAEDRITLEVLRDGETLEIGAVLASDHPARRGMMMFQGNGAHIPFFGPDMHDFEFEGLPDFDFEGMPNFEEFPGLENFRIEVSTEPPAEVEEGFQVLECTQGDITFYVTTPEEFPAAFGCEPYEG